MNDVVWIKLIENLPAIVTALGVIVTAYLGYRTNQQGKVTATKLEENAVKLETVEKSVNGKMEQLLQVSKAAAHAEGMKDESDAQTVRDNPVKIQIVEQPVPVKVVEESK